MGNFWNVDPGFAIDQNPYPIPPDVMDQIDVDTVFQISSNGDSFFVKVREKSEFPAGYICEVIQKPEMEEFQLGDLIFIEPLKVQPPISKHSGIMATDRFGNGLAASYGSFYQPISSNSFSYNSGEWG